MIKEYIKTIIKTSLEDKEFIVETNKNFYFLNIATFGILKSDDLPPAYEVVESFSSHV